HAVALETGRVAGVFEIEFGGGDVIDGALVVSLTHCTLIPGPLRALELAFRCSDGHLGQIRLLLAGEQLATDLDLLARQRGVETVEGGMLTLILVVEL